MELKYVNKMTSKKHGNLLGQLQEGSGISVGDGWIVTVDEAPPVCLTAVAVILTSGVDEDRDEFGSITPKPIRNTSDMAIPIVRRKEGR